MIKRQLLPQRALGALKSFRDLIEDARAMLAGTTPSAWRKRRASEAAAGREANLAASRNRTKRRSAFDPTEFDFNADIRFRRRQKNSTCPRQLTSRTTKRPAGAPTCDATGETRSRRIGISPPNSSANTAEILKFLIDRTGYIKQLEEEDTPEAFSRVENLRELVNAAMDSRDRGETLDQFLDHAALVSDADAYDERAQITLMTLHAAKGLEFPLVFLCGLEEGLFPHSRTFLQPDDIEEERRLCYVGMTRAMDTLVLTRAVYRRRYGTDCRKPACPRGFWKKFRPKLFEDLGSTAAGSVAAGGRATPAARPASALRLRGRRPERELDSRPQHARSRAAAPVRPANYNSIDNIAEFFASRGKKFTSQSAGGGAERQKGISSRAEGYAIQNMAKEPSISAKETVKMPRLRYNSLASV